MSHIVPSEEDSETRATFTGRSNPILNDRTTIEQKAESSPLLSSTPLSVSKVLVKGYPYFVILDKLLSVLTWTNEDGWLSILIVLIYSTIVLYFEFFVTYLGHLLIAATLVGYSFLSKYVENQITTKPTLDDIIHLLTALNIKADLFLNPVTSLALTSYDIKRILFTTVFLSPLYVIVTYFILTPRTFILLFGVYALTYHSLFSQVTRRLLWRFRIIRLLSFYLTGLDFGGININRDSGIFAAVKRVNEKVGIQNKDGKPIVFTYVLHENQRRWLGIGWTPNLLSYERTAWTDEFLNESSPTDKFELPKTEAGSGLVWRWVDKTWRLDLTNDGAIQLSSSRPKTTANPGPDDGYIYYDNTWRRPSTEDSFSKYTRRRRWIRTAELVPINIKKSEITSSNAAAIRLSSTESSLPSTELQKIDANTTTSSSLAQDNTTKKRKSLRFDEQTVLESIKDLENKKGVSFSDKVDNLDTKGKKDYAVTESQILGEQKNVPIMDKEPIQSTTSKEKQHDQ
ncbi:hypothetical protein WICMUC_002958 [Wickerhamomyces mucosus]|uniref:Peroxin/Ferlin domain-containing protein n=1 Tax=Wickerhamomyces mucosus TaxID=1378264 RepID=A0A9P8PMC3_9ASCO|nr:hypothetical protein WICMUC_002958 [Wickerhamomyces mucosus]